MTSTFKGLGTVMDLLSQSNSEVFTVGNTSNTARLRLYDMNTPSSGYCISTTSNIVAKTSSLFIYKASGTGTCVGIGISSLADTTNALYVAGNANVTGTLIADSINARALNVDSVNNANNVNLNTISSATSTNYTFLFADASLGVGNYGSVWGTTTASKTILYNSLTGNVGIGTTTLTSEGTSMKLTVAGDVAAIEGWFWVIGNNKGIYWDTYNGGWHMDESTTLKVYGGKNISTTGNIISTSATGFIGSGASITNLNATNITSGTLAVARGGTGTTSTTGTAGKLVYDTSPTLSNPTFTGTVTAATVNATTLAGSGTSVTSLNAANIASGTLVRERGGTGVSTATGVTGTGNIVFSASPTFSGTITGLAGDGSSLTNVKVGLGVTTTANTNRYLAFTSTSAASTGASLEIDTSLYFNPSTDTLTCSNVAATTLTTNGNVVVRGKFTASNLEILGSTTIIKSYTLGTSNVVINNAGPGPALKVIQSGNNSVAEFWDNETTSAPAMCIINGGFVGIGITNPTSALDVGFGSIKANYFFGSGQYLTDVQAANINDSTITISSSGYLTGTGSFTLNQSTPTTITLSANAATANTVNTLVARDASGNFSAGTINANTLSAGNTTLSTLSAGNTKLGTLSATSTTLGTLSATATTLSTLSATSTTLGTLSAGNTKLGTLSATSTTLGTLSAGATTLGTISAGATSITGTLTATSDSTFGSCYIHSAFSTFYMLNPTMGITNINRKFAISQTSSGQTSINSSNTQPILFYTGAVEKMRMDEEGKLGIGTNNPTEKLDVAGNIKCSGTLSATATTLGTLSAGATSITSTLTATGDSTFGSCYIHTDAGSSFYIYNQTLLGQIGRKCAIVQESDGQTSINSSNTQPILFSTNGVEKIRMDRDGKLGIGTSTPTEKLDVVGNIKCSGTISGNGSGLTNITVATATTATNVSGGTGSLTSLSFGATVGQHINLWGTSFAIGIEDNTLYYRTGGQFYWYAGGSYNVNPSLDTGTRLMSLTYNGALTLGGDGTGTQAAAGTTNACINVVGDNNFIGLGGNLGFVKQHGSSSVIGFQNKLDFKYFSTGFGGITNTTTSTTVMTITTGGNVGIGTFDPTEKLHVVGNIKCTGSLSAGSTTLSTLSAGATTLGTLSAGNTTLGSSTFSAGSSTLGSMCMGNFIYGTDWAGIQHSSLTTSALAGGNYAILQSSSGETRINCSTDQSIGFMISNGHLGAWKSTGLGIGTNAPTAPLHIKAKAGTVTADGSLVPATSGIYCYNESTTANQHSVICARVNGGDAGNPYFSLDIAGQNGWSMGIDNAEGDHTVNSLKFVKNWAFNTNETVMTIKRNGNVGIGTTNPSYLLHVVGSGTPMILCQNTTNSANQHAVIAAYVAGVNATTSAAGNPYLSLDISNKYGWSMGIDNADNKLKFANKVDFLHQGTSYIMMTLSTTGALSVTDDITAFASDIRLKTNIKHIDDALHKINQLSAFTYEFNDLGASLGFSSNVVHAGVSAQEVQRVFPDVVRRAPFDCDDTKPNSSKSGEEYLTVQYEKLVPLLIAGIKEEVKHREALETQLAIQSARLEALEKYLKINNVS